MRTATKVSLLILITINFSTRVTSMSDFDDVQLVTDFIVEYLTVRRIRHVVMFVCWSKADRMRTVKTLSQHNMRVSIPSKKDSLNARKVERMLSINMARLGIVYDVSCYDLDPPVTQKEAYFNTSYAWILLNCPNVDTLSLSISSDVVNLSAYNSTEENGFILHDVFHTGKGKGGRLQRTLIGRWSRNNPNPTIMWSKYYETPSTSRRRDLGGITMNTVTLMEKNAKNIPAHDYLTDERDPELDTMFKMNYQMIVTLREMYNFTIKFVMAENWSDRNSRGMYRSGNLMGLFIDGKGDIMAGALLLRADRVEATDVLYMTYPLRCGFIFRYSGDFGSSQTKFYSPFDKYVWYCLIAIVVIVVVLVWLILLFENVYLDINKTIWSISDTILAVIGACCQMGTEITLVTSASRIIFFIFFFSSLVLYNFYTSSIVSSLLDIRIQKLSLIHLADSPLKCGSVDVGYVHNLLFDVPQYPNMAYFNERKKTKNFYFTLDEGIQKMKMGGFAYHAEFNSMYRTIENSFSSAEICELQEIDTIPRNLCGILGKKHSPYTEIFKVGLTRAAETGILNKQLAKWQAKKPDCQESMIFKEVGFNQITSCHMLLLIGILIATVVVVIEKKKNTVNKKIENDINEKF